MEARNVRNENGNAVIYTVKSLYNAWLKIFRVGLNNILILYIHTIFNNLHNQWARI